MSGNKRHLADYTRRICLCQGRWLDALAIYEEMKQRGLEPNVITCSALISACAKARKLDKAFEVFAEMKQRGLQPEVITCNALISACEKTQQVDKALEIFAEMKWRGLEPFVHKISVPRDRI